MTDFEKFTEENSTEEKFSSWLTGKKNCRKEYKHAVNVWNKF